MANAFSIVRLSRARCILTSDLTMLDYLFAYG